MAPPPPSPGQEPGILYYDPNPTTAKLATASLVLAGFSVLHAQTKDQALELCTAHGPAGDKTIVALLLDAAADARISAAVLRALVQLPGAAELPGILIVSRRNPNPIPGAEGLPTVRRPFSSPALLKVVHETLAGHGRAPKKETPSGPSQRETRLRDVLERQLPGIDFGDESVASVLRELDAAEDLPSPSGDESLRASLDLVRLESVLELVANEGKTGVLEVERDKAIGKLHIQDGKIRLAELRGVEEDLKLGRFVVECGFMRDEELEAFAVGKDPANRPLGQRLVEGGVLTERELAQALVDQAREITCQLLTWRRGEVGFRATEKLHPMADAAKQGGAELLIAEALLDGLRRLDEGALMGTHMAQLDDVYIRVDEQIQRLGREGLTRDELQVLELINGRHSVKEVARKTRTGTFAVASVLYRLRMSNVVRRRVMPVTV